jgi:hypothetical protein
MVVMQARVIVVIGITAGDVMGKYGLNPMYVLCTDMVIGLTCHVNVLWVAMEIELTACNG